MYAYACTVDSDGCNTSSSYNDTYHTCMALFWMQPMAYIDWWCDAYLYQKQLQLPVYIKSTVPGT